LKFSTLIQIIISGLLFLAVWGLFGNSLFQAYFDVLQEREKQTLGAEQKASEIKSQSQILQAEVDEEIKQARVAGIKKRDQLVEQARVKALEITTEAKAAADKKFDAARIKLEQAQAEALAELETEALELSKLVRERALADEVDSKTVH
jgi:F0F1-type ATP synthase membrane subunit b/b'